MMLQRTFHIPREILYSQIADCDSKVIAGDLLELVRLVEDYGSSFGEDSRVGCAFCLQRDREVREEEVMVDDDDVALHRAAAHLGDEAALELAAFLPDAGVGTGV